MSSYLMPEKLRRSSPQPLYSQVYEQLKRELVLRDFRPGERFYSYRRLQEIYGIEPRTVSRAIDLLLRDGLLEKRPASGIYVRPRRAISNVGELWFASLSDGYHPFFFNVLGGLMREAELYGLRVVVHLGGGRRSFLRWLTPSPGESLVLTGRLDDDLLRSVRQRFEGRIILVGNYDVQGDFGRVDCDFAEPLQEALRIAFDLGRRRFALVTGPGDLPISRGLREVFLGCARRLGFSPRTLEEQDEDGYAAAGRLAEFRPDCVLMTEPAFPGVWRRLTQRGLRCPEDVFLIRYGKEDATRLLEGCAAAELACCGEEFGAQACRMLLEEEKTATRRIRLRLTLNN